MKMISIIAAIAENRAIGINNDLPWKLPNDMKRFRELTTGHTVIMGRKTFESLPNGALPNRTNIVVTRNNTVTFENCILFDNLQDAIKKYNTQEEIFVIGGASIYDQVINLADKLYITLVRHSFENANTFFPEINKNEWIMTEQESFPNDEKHLYPYTFQTYIKKK
ncbi:MAG TPA: dihydrofolate reductase [Porphyromonadaceae bacterium]|nr:dihydrofolate reductase [Porphyromonadaceae bacterium]